MSLLSNYKLKDESHESKRKDSDATIITMPANIESLAHREAIVCTTDN